MGELKKRIEELFEPHWEGIKIINSEKLLKVIEEFDKNVFEVRVICPECGVLCLLENEKIDEESWIRKVF